MYFLEHFPYFHQDFFAISDVTNLTQVKSNAIGKVHKGTETTQMKIQLELIALTVHRVNSIIKTLASSHSDYSEDNVTIKPTTMDQVKSGYRIARNIFWFNVVCGPQNLRHRPPANEL